MYFPLAQNRVNRMTKMKMDLDLEDITGKAKTVGIIALLAGAAGFAVGADALQFAKIGGFVGVLIVFKDQLMDIYKQIMG